MAAATSWNANRAWAVDDFVLRKKAAVAGLGVTLLPEGYCDRGTGDGSLVRILPQWTLPKEQHAGPATCRAAARFRRSVL